VIAAGHILDRDDIDQLKSWALICAMTGSEPMVTR